MVSDDILERGPALALWQRRWVWITAGVVLIVVVWGALAVRQLLSARDLALDGVSRLESIRAQVNVDAVTEGELTGQLSEATLVFGESHRRIRSPLVAPLRLVPWVGTQIRSADALSSSASRIAGVLADTADEIAVLSAAATDQDRVAVARDALAITRRARDVLDSVDLGPATGLMRSLDDGRRRFETELSEARDLLDQVEVAAAGVAEFLEGPTTYLVLAANNSEMQAGSGSYLMAGTVSVLGGVLEVHEFRSTSELLLERGAVAIDDEDLAERWGWLEPSTDMRNLSPSPRFAPNAELAAAMWTSLEGEEIDGVIVLDPISLAAVMSATGPVEVDGRSIEADGVVRELLFDQYWEDDVDVRRDRLREIAVAALRTVDETDTDLVSLARGLQEASAGRHLLAWSKHPAQQSAWEAVGIDGALQDDSVSVAVLNRGANKLDSFLSVDAAVTLEPDATVRLAVTLTNRAEAGFPSYVLGPATAFGLEPGTYVGVLALNVPGSARDVAFVGTDSLVAAGPDGNSQVIAIWVEVPAGATATFEASFAVPDLSALRFEPSARVPGVVWTAAGRTWIDLDDVILDLEAGAVSGDALGRTTAPVLFEPDPLDNPVAPLPFMRVDGDTETTVIVDWDVPRSNPPVDVWERRSDGEWELVGSSITERPYWLTGRTREVEYCYRTALHTEPERFSAIECLTVPSALGYLRFPGNPGDYFTTGDFVGTGDLDVRILVAPEDWTPEFWQMFAGQYDSQPNDRAWRFGIDVFTSLVGNFSDDGVEDLGGNRQLPVGVGDGRRKWVRLTIEPERGVQRFWTSSGGRVWTQLGDERRFDPIAGLRDSTGPVYVGTDRPGSDNPFSGKLYYFEVRDGIDGPIIANLDFRTPDQMDGTPARWIDDSGNVFSSHGSGWEYVLSDD